LLVVFKLAPVYVYIKLQWECFRSHEGLLSFAVACKVLCLHRRWEDNIKTAITCIVWEGVNWIDLGQDGDKTGCF
jgi:hypothetical protein